MARFLFWEVGMRQKPWNCSVLVVRVHTAAWWERESRNRAGVYVELDLDCFCSLLQLQCFKKKVNAGEEFRCADCSSPGSLSSDNNFDSKDIKEEEAVYICHFIAGRIECKNIICNICIITQGKWFKENVFQDEHESRSPPPPVLYDTSPLVNSFRRKCGAALCPGFPAELKSSGSLCCS